MNSSSAPGTGPRRNKHDWNGLESYLATHFRHLRNWEHFITSDSLIITPNDENGLVIERRLDCQDGLFIDIKKTIEINENNQVRTIAYKYHAGIHGDPTRSIFRYDDAHIYVREGHADAHHKHRFDHTTWREIDPPEWIGEERWSTLGEVIEELHEWWYETGRFLFAEE